MFAIFYVISVIFYICGKARLYTEAAAPCQSRSMGKPAKDYRLTSPLDGSPGQGVALGKSGALHTRQQRKTTLSVACKELRAHTSTALSDQGFPDDSDEDPVVNFGAAINNCVEITAGFSKVSPRRFWSLITVTVCAPSVCGRASPW